MSLWQDLKNISYIYSPPFDPWDMLDLLERTQKAFGRKPKIGKKGAKLKVITTNMLDANRKLQEKYKKNLTRCEKDDSK